MAALFKTGPKQAAKPKARASTFAGEATVPATPVAFPEAVRREEARRKSREPETIRFEIQKVEVRMKRLVSDAAGMPKDLWVAVLPKLQAKYVVEQLKVAELQNELRESMALRG